jgi:hypothetical protein
LLIALKMLLDLLKNEDSDVPSKAVEALDNSNSEIQLTLAQLIEQHFDLPHSGSVIDMLWYLCA